MKKNKRVIIGLTGADGVGKSTAANILKKLGFHKVSVESKVKDFASHLFSDEELQKAEKEILNKLRQKGCGVNKEYWINLVLIEVTGEKNLIVFDDISTQEATSNKIKVFQICRPSISDEKIEGVNVIMNDGTKEEFIKKIESLYKTL